MEGTSFNLRHLKAMAATAATGSVSAAARLVNLSQPAITQGVAKLEAQLGTALFDRRPHGMAPTEAARILAPRVEAALALIGSPRVTTPQLRAFLALARHGSYVSAAREMGIRVASLHRAVADLAIGIGAQLVERRGRGVALTSRGQALARRFRLADAELRAAIADLAALRGLEQERIAIGAMPLSRARLLPNAVAAFNRAHPEIDIEIAEGAYAELIGPLRDGDVDLIVGALRSPGAEDLVQHALFIDRPVVLARRGHPLAGRAEPPAADELAAYGWAMPPSGAPLRNQWDAIFSSAGLAAPRVAIECGSVIMIRQLLMQTDLLTLLSPDQVAVELEAGWLARIGPAPGDPRRTIGYTTRAGWRPTRLQRAFLDALAVEAARIGDTFSIS